MSITTTASGSTMITGQAISLYRYLALRSAMRLEMLGMKHSRGVSAYAIVKKEFGFKGSKEKVLEQLNQWLASEQARNMARN